MAFIPEAGDIVWLHFTPQAGRRPALVLSPSKYNRIGLMLCCPMTIRAKGYPFEVAIGNGAGTVVLADQVKSLDWKVRKARRKGEVSPEELAAVRGKAIALISGA